MYVLPIWESLSSCEAIAMKKTYGFQRPARLHLRVLVSLIPEIGASSTDLPGPIEMAMGKSEIIWDHHCITNDTRPGYVKIAIEAMAQSK